LQTKSRIPQEINLPEFKTVPMREERVRNSAEDILLMGQVTTLEWTKIEMKGLGWDRESTSYSNFVDCL
jgi:hypothetical protein